jgi:dTDP-4-dehydrorhamnose reductase
MQPNDVVLVTGSTGLLGSYLVPILIENDFNVKTHSLTGNTDVSFDLTCTESTHKGLLTINPKLIINLVGLTSVEECESNINSAFLTNSFSVENIVSWIENYSPACHLIHISTDHIYDDQSNSRENDVNIQNTYALTKYCGELAARKIHSTILRTNFVGKSKTPKRESLSDWVVKSLLEAKQVEVLCDVYFSPLSLNILSELIVTVSKVRKCGVFNLGSNNGMSKADFDIELAKHLGYRATNFKLIKLEDAWFLKARRPKNMCMDVSKFERTFGVKLPCLRDIIPLIAAEYNNDK